MAGFGDEHFLFRGPTGVTDLSSNGRNGTYVGGMGTVSDTGSGGVSAFSFDGSDDFIDLSSYVSSFNTVGNCHFGCWFKGNIELVILFSVTEGNTNIVRNLMQLVLGENITVDLADELITTQRVLTNLNRQSRAFASKTRTLVLDNQWHLINFVYDGIATKIYLDGTPRTTVQGSGSGTEAETGVFGGFSTVTHAAIGARRFNNTWSLLMNGRLDDIRFSPVRTDAEILAWHNAGRGYDVFTPSRRRRSRSGGGVL
jgi:hypothetical protein